MHQEICLTFRVGSRLYAFEFGRLREIRGTAPLAPPETDERGLLGMMRVLGVRVPVYDLRTLLEQERAPRAKSNVLLLVHAGGGVVGLIADAVEDVAAGLNIEPSDGSSFVLGTARQQRESIEVLCLDRLLGEADEAPIAA